MITQNNMRVLAPPSCSVPLSVPPPPLFEFPRLRSRDAFTDFMRVMAMYSADVITRSELLSLVSDLIGKFQDLMVGCIEPRVQGGDHRRSLVQGLFRVIGAQLRTGCPSFRFLSLQVAQCFSCLCVCMHLVCFVPSLNIETGNRRWPCTFL